MISTGCCLDRVAPPQRVLTYDVWVDERVAVLGEVAVAGASYEAAIPRGVKPSTGLAIRDDRLRWTMLLLAARTALPAAAAPSSSASATVTSTPPTITLAELPAASAAVALMLVVESLGQSGRSLDARRLRGTADRCAVACASTPTTAAVRHFRRRRLAALVIVVRAIRVLRSILGSGRRLAPITSLFIGANLGGGWCVEVLIPIGVVVGSVRIRVGSPPVWAAATTMRSSALGHAVGLVLGMADT
jgi:hypothetical protein